MQHVGVEPSGDAFNAIELHGRTNRPFNPMINTGAITVTALLHARHGDRTFEHVLDSFSAVAGRPLAIDEAVYESERRTGHRNRAIAHLLLNFGVVHEEAEAALDVYFKQCSILVTCRDLAMMAATLANMGRHPVTGRHAFSIALREGHALDHVHLRDVRLLGAVGLSRRRPRQERGRRRGDGGRQPPARHRRPILRGSIASATACAAPKCASTWRRGSGCTSSTV